MQTTNPSMLAARTSLPGEGEPLVTTGPVPGRRIEIGSSFTALSFDHARFDDLMDPLVMVDHFTMSEPAFGAHPHAGISAVSVLLEDSTGVFNNRDTLGNDIDLEPGDLYWLKAGRGVIHDEHPRPGSRTHGLQIFVNLPAAAKHDAPESLHVRAADMPELRGDGYRVRVVLGDTPDVSGQVSPALPLTILDVHLDAGGRFTHTMPSGVHAWVHPIRGAGQVVAGDVTVPLGPGEAIAVHNNAGAAALELRSETGAELVVLQGRPLNEPIAQRQGFVMNTSDELTAAAAAHAAGAFGSLD